MVGGLEGGGSQLLFVHRSPYVNDVGENEWYEERNVTHRLQRELGRGCIADGEGVHRVQQRRIEGSVAIACNPEEGCHDKERPDTCEPYALGEMFCETRFCPA